MRTSPWQLARLFIVYFNSQAAIFLVPTLLNDKDYQGWMGIIAGYLGSLALLWFTVYVVRANGNKPWIQFGRKLLGRWIHGFFVLLVLAWCVYYTAFDMQTFVLFFSSNYLRDTPPWFILTIIGLVILYTVTRGFPTLVYMAEGLFLLIIGTMAYMAFLFTQQADYQMMRAMVTSFDGMKLMKHGVITLSWFAEWILLLFVAPDLKLEKGTFKRIAIAETGLCLVVLYSWLLILMIFGPYLGAEFDYPYVIRSMNTESIMSKTAPLLIGVWSASMFIHSAFLIYCAIRSVLHFTRGKGERLMAPVLIGIAWLIAYYYANHLAIYRMHFYSTVTVILWIVVELIPVYYTFAFWFPLRRRKTSAAA
ncbi:GerAB/ArcD/ProY family transporter [Gorillibacterium sp. CAU 1737]|uniref:GerAB/ArcD/ProY family transporter n=1 Tax=Gorillibacterium sp. CAU 1737 TaxID=3140362 RepID=UPI003261C0C2